MRCCFLEINTNTWERTKEIVSQDTPPGKRDEFGRSVALDGSTLVVGASPEEKNPKGELQEKLQALAPKGPEYIVIDESGPDHQKSFKVKVVWLGRKLGEGEGNSKKDAETKAACEALSAGVWEK